MKDTIWKKKWVAYLAAIFCNFLWGSAFSFVKIGYQLFEVPEDDPAAQILFAGCRFFLAGLLTLLFACVGARRLLLPKKGSYHKVLILSLFQTILQYFFFYIGLAHTTGTKATILCTFQVFFSILISTLLFRMEKLSARKLLGCLLGLTGVVLVNLNGLHSVSFAFNGEGFILLCAACGAASSVLMKRFSKGENPVLMSGCQFAFGGLVMMAAGFAFGGRLAPPSVKSASVLLYLALLSAVAYGLWAVILKYHPVSKITIFCFANPLCGVILSTLLLQEGSASQGFFIPAALVLVCTGIFLVNRSPAKLPETGKDPT